MAALILCSRNISAEPTLARNGIYFQDVPITIFVEANTGYKFIGWSDISLPNTTTVTKLLPLDYTLTALFEKDSSKELNVVINEIMYKPSNDINCDDWFELFNPTKNSVDLGGWTFQDKKDTHLFSFSNKTLIKSNDYLVVCEDTNSFISIYPEIKNITGNFNFGIGEVDIVRLHNQNKILIDSVSYSSQRPWYPEANGTGATLELINPIYNNLYPESWQVSFVLKGTPGKVNSVYKTDVWSYDFSNIRLISYPNPANSESELEFFIPNNAIINLSLYNSLGIEVSRILNNQPFNIGIHTFSLFTEQLPSGVYFYNLELLILGQKIIKTFPFQIIH